MDTADYARAVRIAQRACRGRRLSRDEWQQVEQDAAVALWRTGSVTRAWWAAVDAARTLQGVRRAHKAPVMVQLVWDGPSTVDVEAEALSHVTVERLLACLSVPDRMMVEETVLSDRAQQAVADELGVHDGTVCRRRARALERLRVCMST